MTNALVRRVRRHASIAILHRSQDPASIRPAPSIGQPTDIIQQNRSVVQATLVPAGSSLPLGLALADVEGGQTPFTAPQEGARLSPPVADLESQSPLTPTLPQAIQKEQTTQQSEQAPQPDEQALQPGEQAPQPDEQAPQPGGQTPQPGEQAPVITSVSSPSGSTISSSEWTRLRRFMEGHQEKLAREKAEQEAAGPVQLSPGEEAKNEAKRKAQEEIVRRQELVQGGQRAKAKVVYLTPEDQKVEDEPPVSKATDTPSVSAEPEVDVERTSTQPDMALESDFIPEAPVEDSDEQVKPLEASASAAERELPAELEGQPKNISPLEQADLPQEHTTPIPTSPGESAVTKSQIQAQESGKKAEPPPAEIESEPEIARGSADNAQLAPSVGEMSSTSAEPITETDPDYIEPEPEIDRQPADSVQLTPSSEETSSTAAEPVSDTDPDYQEVSTISDDSKTTGLGGRLFRAVKSLIGSEPDKPPASPSVIQKKQDSELSTAEQLPESLPETGLPEDDPSQSSYEEIVTPELNASPDDLADENDLFDSSPEVTEADMGQSYEAEAPEPDQVAPTVSDSTSSIHKSPEQTAPSPGTVDESAATSEPIYQTGDYESDMPTQTVIDSTGVVQKSSEPVPSGAGAQSDPDQTVEKHRPVEPTQAEQPLPSKEHSSIGTSTFEEPAVEQMSDAVEASSEGAELEAETAAGLTLESDDTVATDLARSSEPESKPEDTLAPPEISEQGLYRPADVATDDTDETVIQQMPLDKAWPVQKSKESMRTEPDIEDAASYGPSTSTEARTQEPVIQRRIAADDAVSDQIEEVLGEVIPGQVSDSSIELVLPRRPRPVSAAVNLPPTVQAETDGPERVEHQEFSDQVPDQAESSRPSTIQKQPRDAADAAKPVDMIPTEIGPLPSDLWQLLGQSPPEIQSRQPAEKSPPSQASVQRATEAVEKAPPALVEPTPQVTDLAREMVRPDIQRVDAGSQVSDVSDSSEADGESSEEKEEDSEANIDGLARQVYPIIKRMLALERERSRGRF